MTEAVSALLAPLSTAFAGAVGLRGWLYDRAWLPIHRLPVPVISVGNLSVGGTGKSPMVAMVARTLAAGGASPAIVSRGHGGTHRAGARVVSSGDGARAQALEVGDEPVMLAGMLLGIPVIVSRRRAEGGDLAVSGFRAGCIILDDGFQHRQLARNLDLVLLDAGNPFGNGKLLPAGPLREPPSALGRAGAIVLTRADRIGSGPRQALEARIREHAPSVPIFHARTRALGLLDMRSRAMAPVETLRGMKVVCFAGIARPEAFFQDVESAGARVTAKLAFPDHHRFTPSDIKAIAAAASSSGADWLLTTEKDVARLAGPAGADALDGLGSLWALRVATEVDERESFEALVRGVLA